MTQDDLLSMLLPDAAGERAERARRLIERPLFSIDAPPPRRDLERARRELDRMAEVRILLAVESLLRHHLGVAAPVGSALWFGTPELDHGEAWRELFRAGPGAFPELALPGPGESLTTLATRLLDLADRRTGAWGRRGLWEARLALLAGLPDLAVAVPGQEEGEMRLDRASLLLDLGRIEEAREALGHPGTPRARQLLDWCRLALDREAMPGPFTTSPGPTSGAVRDLLAALGSEQGTAAPGRGPVAQGREAGDVEVVYLPTDPLGKGPRRMACGGGRGHASEPLGGLEQRLLLSGTIARQYGAAGVSAVALAPIVDPVTEGLRGWIRVESSHRLLPSDEVLTARARAAHGLLPNQKEAAWGKVRPAPRTMRALESLEACLPAPTSLFRVERGEPVPVRLDGPLPSRSDLARTALAQRPLFQGDGVVLPVALVDRPLAFVVGEGPTESLERSRLEQGAAAVAFDVAWAGFADACERRGESPPMSFVDPGFERLCMELLVSARGGAPLLLWGGPGSGKRTLARWLHHVTGETRELRVVEVHEWPRLGTLEAQGRPLLFVGPARVPMRERNLLRRFLERRSRRKERSLCLFLGESADLRQALALEGVSVVRIPGLDERRGELPQLMHTLLEEAAGRRGLPVPECDEEALALCFRQDWAGGMRELGQVLERCLERGARIDGGTLALVMGVMGIEVVERLSPRRTSRATLVAALRATRTGTGRWNKRRAARFLGWDPETLARHMRAHHLEGGAGTAR